MSTLIIEHLLPSELPPQWVQRMHLRPGQTVTVRIETEVAPIAADEPIHPEVAAISGLVAADIDTASEYHAAMLRKHTP